MNKLALIRTGDDYVAAERFRPLSALKVDRLARLVVDDEGLDAAENLREWHVLKDERCHSLVPPPCLRGVLLLALIILVRHADQSSRTSVIVHIPSVSLYGTYAIYHTYACMSRLIDAGEASSTLNSIDKQACL